MAKERRENKHKEEKMRYPFNGEIVGVDRGISQLVCRLWAAQIETYGSCEDMGDGYMHLAFSPADAEVFLEVVVGENRDSILYASARGEGDESWRWTTWPDDMALSMMDDDKPVELPKPMWNWIMVVEFPKKHYNEMVENARAFTERFKPDFIWT